MGEGWVLEPKWDGFRLLVSITDGGRIRAWSRHGTSLGARLGELIHTAATVDEYIQLGVTNQIVLLDLNAWPSYAKFRDKAAQAIADYLAHRFHRGPRAVI